MRRTCDKSSASTARQNSNAAKRLGEHDTRLWRIVEHYQDASPTAIADAAGVSRQVVYRVQDDPAKAEAMLAEWGM